MAPAVTVAARWPDLRMALIVLGVSLTSLLLAVFVAEGRQVSIGVTLLGHAELVFLGYRYKQYRDGRDEDLRRGGR